MSSSALASFEWHDLPVAAVSLTERGVELVVTPWVETESAYAARILRISEATTLEVNFTGALSPEDLGSLEVGKFDYALCSAGMISGTIGILPGRTGYWTISFTDAIWSLEAG